MVELTTSPPRRRVINAANAIAAMVVFTCISFVIMYHANLAFKRSMLDLFENRHVSILEPSKSLAAEEHGQRLSVKYRVKNHTSRPVKIIGSRASCTCTMVGNLPMVVGPHQASEIPVSVTVPDQDDFGGTVELYTDDGASRVLTLTFTGHVGRKEGPRSTSWSGVGDRAKDH